MLYNMATGEQPSDLDHLREEFSASGWRFGTVWASAASGPDKRRLYATRDGVTLTAWNRFELAADIRREERNA
jgi:hypothetical protein